MEGFFSNWTEITPIYAQKDKDMSFLVNSLDLVHSLLRISHTA